MLTRPFPPTPQQLDTLRWIAGYQLAHDGISPTFAEIRDALGIHGKSGVARVLDALEERGALRRLPNRHRAIEILVDIPVPRSPRGAPLFFVPLEGAAHG